MMLQLPKREKKLPRFYAPNGKREVKRRLRQLILQKIYATE